MLVAKENIELTHLLTGDMAKWGMIGSYPLFELDFVVKIEQIQNHGEN